MGMRKHIDHFLSLNSDFDAYLFMVKTPKGLIGIADGSIVDIAALAMTSHARVSHALLTMDGAPEQSVPETNPIVFH
jgi:hypothetical protein